MFGRKEVTVWFPITEIPYSIYNPACGRQVIKNEKYSKGNFYSGQLSAFSYKLLAKSS
ncbi:MAG: hypothetical protein HY963_10820 [Ignavibacteriales bacterium]|nr:hypothetical protein [Ignavibacteriales bacterium]